MGYLDTENEVSRKSNSILHMPTPTLVVAGTSSGVGKTTVAVGIIRALHAAGLRVQPFKVGPDFLDGMQHTQACSTKSVNLDGWMLGKNGCLAAYHEAVAESEADIAVVEGCMGLHDGRDGCSDEGSTAQVAKWLGAPVLLVVDAWALARSAAAMVHGFKTFDSSVNVAAVIFNRVAGTAHAEWIRQAMASATTTADVAVLGALPSDQRLVVKERLLGLLPPHSGATGVLSPRLGVLERLMNEHVDIVTLRAVAATAAPPPAAPQPPPIALRPPPLAAPQVPPPVAPSLAALSPVRIAVARDEAFCFLYHDNLRHLERAGATLCFFSPLTDDALPADADALYLIGGYPELYGVRLAANESMRRAVVAFCAGGGLVWAECGGLMYLAERLQLRVSDVETATEARSEITGNETGAVLAGTAAGAAAPCDETCGAAGAGCALPSERIPSTPELLHTMCGVLPFDVSMTARLQMGYCTATLRAPLARLLRLPEGMTVRCQQFHFSEPTINGEPAVQVDMATGGGAGIATVDVAALDVVMESPGARSAPEGAVVHGRTVATYCHFHFGSDERLAPALVGAARRRQRVVSLLPSGTEIVALLLGDEAAERLIGVSEHCDWPPSLVCGLPAVSRSAVRLHNGMSGEEVDAALKEAKASGLGAAHVLDIEWLATHRPGLVLTQDTCDVCDAGQSAVRSALLAAGLEPSRALTIAPTTVAQMLDAIERVGAALGETRQVAATAIGGLVSRLDAIGGAVAAVPMADRPRVLGLESVCPLVASGMWLPDMRELAGGCDALGGTAGCAARVVTMEEVAASDAAVVVLCCCGRTADGTAVEVEAHLLQHAAFWQLPALRARPPRLYLTSHDHFSRPGPRLVDGIETLASLVHPAALPPELVARATADVLRLVIDEETATGVDDGRPTRWHFERMAVDGHAHATDAPTDMAFASAPASAPSTSASASASACACTCASSPAAAAPSGATPRVRSASVLAVIESNGLLIFGGEAADATRLDDVWSLHPSGDGWTPSSCPSVRWEGPWTCGVTANEAVPTARSNHAAVVCGEHLLVFGGWSADGSTPLSAPELLHLRTRCWTHCSTRNAPPPPRGNPSLVYSPQRHLAIVYAGWNGHERLDDVWCLDMESWRWHRAASDSTGGDSGDDRDDGGRGGGDGGGGGGDEAGRGGGGRLGGGRPSPRTDHVAVLWRQSTESECMVVFGGSTHEGASDELWSLDCSVGEPGKWRWKEEGSGRTSLAHRGPWPPPRTSHAAAIAGSGTNARLLVVGGQDGRLGSGAGAIVADAWVFGPLGSTDRLWSRLDWRGTFPLQRCRHSLVVIGGLAIVYGGYDGAHTLDEHHSLFCAPLHEAPSEPVANACADMGAVRQRQQERWMAERPVTVGELPANERARAARSPLPLAIAKALHRLAMQSEPPRHTYIDPDTGYSVFTQAYLKRRPCCGNGCRHCPWGHINVPGRSKSRPADDEESDLEW